MIKLQTQSLQRRAWVNQCPNNNRLLQMRIFKKRSQSREEFKTWSHLFQWTRRVTHFKLIMYQKQIQLKKLLHLQFLRHLKQHHKLRQSLRAPNLLLTRQRQLMSWRPLISQSKRRHTLIIMTCLRQSKKLIERRSRNRTNHLQKTKTHNQMANKHNLKVTCIKIIWYKLCNLCITWKWPRHQIQRS